MYLRAGGVHVATRKQRQSRRAIGELLECGPYSGLIILHADKGILCNIVQAAMIRRAVTLYRMMASIHGNCQ
jgi:hypothetical protein